MKDNLRGIGGFLIILGLAAIVLNYFDMVPKILIWIYKWGEVPAWGIKIGFIVVGVILYLLGMGKEEVKEAPNKEIPNKENTQTKEQETPVKETPAKEVSDK